MHAILAALALLLSAYAPPPSLHSVELNTGPFACNSQQHEVTATGGMNRVRKVYVWTGLDMGARADLVVHVVKAKVSDVNGESYETV